MTVGATGLPGDATSGDRALGALEKPRTRHRKIVALGQPPDGLEKETAAVAFQRAVDPSIRGQANRLSDLSGRARRVGPKPPDKPSSPQ